MSDHFDIEDDFMSDDLDSIYSDVDNDRWDDLELEFQEFLTLYNFLQTDEDEKRKTFWDHEPLDWSKHVEKLRHEGLFSKHYRMSEKAFTTLLLLLLLIKPKGGLSKSFPLFLTKTDSISVARCGKSNIYSNHVL